MVNLYVEMRKCSIQVLYTNLRLKVGEILKLFETYFCRFFVKIENIYLFKVSNPVTRYSIKDNTNTVEVLELFCIEHLPKFSTVKIFLDTL